MDKNIACIIDWVETAATKMLDYKQGQPSLRRLVTVPIGAVIFGMAFAVSGMIHEYGNLAKDFRQARLDKNAKATEAL